MSRTSRMGEAMGRDARVVERAVAATWNMPMALRMLAIMCGVGEAKVAITMKYAVIDGLMERTSRDPQDTWRATDKGKATFPLTGGGEPYDSRGGVPGEEADQWQ